MIFVTQDEEVITDAVLALQKKARLSRPVFIATVGDGLIARGNVTRVRNLPNGPRGERRAEIHTDDVG